MLGKFESFWVCEEKRAMGWRQADLLMNSRDELEEPNRISWSVVSSNAGGGWLIRTLAASPKGMNRG